MDLAEDTWSEVSLGSSGMATVIVEINDIYCFSEVLNMGKMYICNTWERLSSAVSQSLGSQPFDDFLTFKSFLSTNSQQAEKKGKK